MILKFALTALFLGIASLPIHAQFSTGQAADIVLGQAIFTTSTIGNSDSEMNTPEFVLVDPTTGKVFVADSTNNRVLRFSSAAAMMSGSAAEAVLGQPAFGSGSSDNPTIALGMDEPIALAMSPAGTLWVADTSNNRVLRFNNAAIIPSGSQANGVLGQVNLSSSAFATAQAGMDRPAGLALDNLGNLWVADYGNNRVTRFDNAADKDDGADADAVLGQETFLTAGFATDRDGMDSPYGITITPDGTLWVCDAGNNRVLRFDDAADKLDGDDADGVVGQANFNSNGTGLSDIALGDFPSGIAVDPAGNLFVSDSDNHRVLFFPAAASLTNGPRATIVIGQPNFTTNDMATTQTSLGFNSGITIDSSGKLWVADGTNHRILRFSPANPPVPTPTPIVDTTRPTIKVKGRRSVDSLRNRVVFRGTAADASGIAGIEFRVSGKAGFQQARGTTRWKAVVRPDKNKRKTVVRVRAIDASGNKSRFLKLKIFRR